MAALDRNRACLRPRPRGMSHRVIRGSNETGGIGQSHRLCEDGCSGRAPSPSRSVACRTIEQWDCDPWVLNTAGGIVDLRTGNIGPHRPDAYITKITAVAPERECPRWRQRNSAVTPTVLLAFAETSAPARLEQAHEHDGIARRHGPDGIRSDLGRRAGGNAACRKLRAAPGREGGRGPR
jgi:hypothetical protein